MPFRTRAAALLERIDALEEHAAALEGAFMDARVKAEASEIVTALERARTQAHQAADIARVDAVSRQVDELGRRLAAVGRVR